MRIWAFIALVSTAFLLVQCMGDLEEEKKIAEDKKIESYLNSYTFQKQNDVYHAIVTPGYGYNIVEGDSVAFWFKGYTLDNKVFETNIVSVAIDEDLDTTFRNFDSLVYVVGSNSLIEGLNRGIPLCREGETSKILFSSIYGFGNENIGPIAAWSPLGYDITIIYVLNASIRNEQQTINSIIEESEFDYSKNNIGLWYNITVNGSVGDNPAIGDTIWGWYNEMLPSGEIIFEVETENKMIILGEENITDGLSSGFTLLKSGGEAVLIAPSPIAYGVVGNENVDPYTPVLYQIRLDSIK